MTPEEIANLVDVRRPRDLMDRDYAQPTVGAPGQDVDNVLSQPWGARDCAFRDPSGNLVRIAQA